ncbi:hypothetical protein LAH08_02980 [Micromonospora noduli]|uniref:Tc1-like transposase DDE domain-containing protein n=1 Tax=Micromonospora noduli TaxID=709876 RepID=A0A328N2I0_9ACTN|nr:hypothetical protein LAH08_02980 [Micromonospora noduli]
MVVLASAGGNSVPVIARLVHADEDPVRQVIHRFNEMGMASLDSQWAGGRPRRISSGDETFIIATANNRPAKLGRPFTCWSVRKLAEYLAHNPDRRVVIGRERLRQLLRSTRSPSSAPRRGRSPPTRPQGEAGPHRARDRTVPAPHIRLRRVRAAHGRPHGGVGWAPRRRPRRLPANYSKLHGLRQFHGCYSIGDDQLWGVIRTRKSAGNTLAALKSIRAARPDGAPIYVILDNLSAHKGFKIRQWAARNAAGASPPPEPHDQPGQRLWLEH